MFLPEFLIQLFTYRKAISFIIQYSNDEEEGDLLLMIRHALDVSKVTIPKFEIQRNCKSVICFYCLSDFRQGASAVVSKLRAAVRIPYNKDKVSNEG
jgi:hypothetical protein